MKNQAFHVSSNYGTLLTRYRSMTVKVMLQLVSNEQQTINVQITRRSYKLL